MTQSGAGGGANAVSRNDGTDETAGKQEAHEVLVRDVERVGEVLRLGTNRF